MLAISLTGLLSGAGPAAGGWFPTGCGDDNWPQWRGPLATGVAPHGDPPLRWNEADGTNIRWKTEIPGRGHSTPVVWGDRIFLTTAIPLAMPCRRAPARRPAITTTFRSPIATDSWPWRSAAPAARSSGSKRCARRCRTSKGTTPPAWRRTRR